MERLTGVCTSQFHKIAYFALICGYSDRVDQGGSDGGARLIRFLVHAEKWMEEVHLLHESMI
jgi:hypothetical protein